MARIAFIPYPETGHLNPTLKLAKSLKSRGHQVYYLGLPDFERTITAEGLNFLPLFERLCPLGFLDQQAIARRIPNFEAMLYEGRKQGDAFQPEEEIRQAVQIIRPDLFLVDLLLPHIALVAQGMRVSTVLLNIILFNPWETIQPLYDSIREMPELVLCPEEFEFPRLRGNRNCYYIEPCID